ncbi:MAG: PQQ-binding-like beta-propeller repeat protein [Acidobacteriota bacterium]
MAGLAVLAASVAAGQDWNQWRGADRDGVSEGAAWPERLDAEALRQVWRRGGLGPSYSSPVVSGGLIYTTENSESATEGVLAFDQETGEPRWARSWSVHFDMPESVASTLGNWPKSTPTVAGDELLFLGIAERLHSLDARTGESRWSLDFPRHFGTPAPEFGSSTSPLVWGSSVYVQAAGALVAVDRRTGEVRWRVLDLFAAEKGAAQAEHEDLEAYGSPILATVAGTPQVVAHTVEGLAGVDAHSGEVLWQVAVDRGPGDSPNVTPTLWWGAGADRSNALVLTSTESSGTPMYRIAKKGSTFSAEEIWRSKVHGNMASPVIAGDRAYLPLKNGRLAFLDLGTGREVWISKPLFRSYASAVRRGDKMLLLSTDGRLHLLKATDDRIALLDERQVAERTWAHLAVQGDRIFVRSHGSLLAFEWTAPRPGRSDPQSTGR